MARGLASAYSCGARDGGAAQARLFGGTTRS
jgi:hypothetical protein